MLYEAEKGDFTLALAGDTMLTRKLTPFKEERFLGCVRLSTAAMRPSLISKVRCTPGTRDAGNHAGNLHDDGAETARRLEMARH